MSNVRKSDIKVSGGDKAGKEAEKIIQIIQTKKREVLKFMRADEEENNKFSHTQLNH